MWNKKKRNTDNNNSNNDDNHGLSNLAKDNDITSNAQGSSKGGVSANSTQKKKDGAQNNKNDATRHARALAAPVPPDGGWGWVVTFSSFMLGFLVDGICFTFGVFFSDFQSYFNASKSTTSSINSVLTGTYLSLVQQITAQLQLEKSGFYKLCVFFSDFQSYFNASKSTTSSINSVLTGTYLSLGPIVGALVNKYGCKKVAMVGTVISTISFFLCTFSPNAEVMIVLYGLCGGIGFGLMYLPSIVMVGYYFDKRRALATGIAVCGSGIGSFAFSPFFEYLIQQFTWKGAMWIIAGLVLNGVAFSFLFRPLEYVDTDVNVFEDGPADKDFNKQIIDIDSDKHRHLNPIYRCRSLEHVKQSGQSSKMSETARLGNSLYLDKGHKTERPTKHVLNPLVRKDIFYSGSIRNLPEFQKAGNEDDFVRSMLSLHGSETETIDSENTGGFWQSIHEMFDLSLLKSPTFGLYGLSCFLCMIGFFVPFIYIPDIAKGYGMDPSETAWIISTIGITNTLGRIVAGYVSDKPWADCIVINMVSLVIGGVATMFVPFYSHYALQIIYALLFGFCIAAFVSLRSIIIVELLGIDKLTSSFGLVVLYQGLSTFIGSPIAGAISDITGDYRASFYLAGTVITVSGLLCLPLRRLSVWEAERAAKKKEDRTKADVESSPMLTSNGVHTS